MSPWTALLQSLHSALIDEVTDRHAEPKPELGLPKKFSTFQLPYHEEIKVFWVKTSFGESHGAVLLAYQKEFMDAMTLKAPQFWELLLKRAQMDFSRRQITPAFAKPAEFLSSEKTPAELSSFPRAVWMPISLPGGTCWFGIAA